MYLFLWIILLIIAWPVAILMLILYPFFWLVLLPFRVLGFAVEGLLDFVKALFRLPAKILR